MSAYVAHLTPTRHAVRCDRSGCTERYEPLTAKSARYESTARKAAGEAGWQVRPVVGAGSRTAGDFCPGHRTATT